MMKVVDLRIDAKYINNQDYINTCIVNQLGIRIDDLTHIEPLKRSIDARKSQIKYNLRLAVYINEPFEFSSDFFHPQNVELSEEVVIIGSGPAGLFAALEAIEVGLKPIIFERGKDVRTRRRDLVKIHKEHRVDEDSNYCFGEGGAGTYSDGKLYTRSKKRGNLKKVLEWFVHFGADRDILVNAHPHIGTNKLPKIIQNMREEIIRCGGKVHFESRITDLELIDNAVTGVTVNNSNKYPVKNLILATGHSARDIFYLLNDRGIKIEAKPFAIGVRIEHTQELIDRIQYHGQLSGEDLPPASYSLVAQAKGMGVYSFCMCPGGIVAPCATKNGEVVTNGWSPSKRNNPFANSGIVVQVEPKDLPNYTENDPFVALNFQKDIEQKCWAAAGKTQAVPGQRLVDFMDNKLSGDLPKSSYQPGAVSVNLNTVLPNLITERLKIAFREFGKKMNGFMTNDAIIHAPESRTSSPVKIPRDEISLEHIEVKGLYPCGEGAGYAGGIVSAAIDGMRCMDKIAEKLTNKI
jgi:uncharacterized FAD-dependent dehydrogenase